MKISGVIKKELKEIIRDKGFISTIILLPLVLMFISGYAFQNDIRDLDAIIINDDNSRYSKDLVQKIEDSIYFDPIPFSGSFEDAKELLSKSEVRIIFYIPDDFGSNLDNATHADISIYLDSSDYIYNILKGASAAVIKDSLKGIVEILVSDLEEERDSNQKRVDEIQELLDGLNNKVKNASSNINNLTARFNETGGLLQSTKLRVEATESEIRKIRSEIYSLQSEIEDNLLILDQVTSSLKELSQLNPSLKVSIDQIIKEIDDIKSDIGSYVNDIEKLDPSSRLFVSTDNYNLNEIDKNMNLGEDNAHIINETFGEIERKYNDIQAKMDSIHLQLRTLKKEFLSFPVGISEKYLFGEISYFQYITPAVMTLILFFIGIVLTTLNIVNERAGRTLFRIATTPLGKADFMAAKFLIFFFVGIFEIIYVLLLAVLWFDVQIVGSLINVFLILSLLMASSIGLGLLISSVVKTMRQAVMIVPLIIIPSILISQMFSPIDTMPGFIQNLAYASPMFYSNIALREVMIKGTGLGGILAPMFILTLYSFITLWLGILVFKKRM